MKNLLILFWILAFVACKHDQVVQNSDDEVLAKYLNLPPSPYNYANLPLPTFLQAPQFQNMDNTPSFNPTTDDGATLGRVLFYEKKLSRNNTVSCANCHKQENGFSDDLVLSEGFEGQLTGRHSMGLINAKYYTSGKFFWDERAATLEDQVLMPMQDSIEMGMTLTEIIQRLKATEYYPILFNRAFGSTEITTEKTAYAIAQFVRSMVSYQTRFDVARAASTNQFVDFTQFTEEENRGKFLFFGIGGLRCGACHGSEAFVATGARNNGLDATNTDLGVGGITGNANEMGQFKAPSIRGILLRAPYMHDGRFATINQVLEHYSTGIQPNPNLDQELKDFNTGLPKEFNLSEYDKQSLIAFFGTLTDSTMLVDPKFSDPFK